MWKAGTFQVVAPPVSIKDRWVGPREQVLNVPIACWCYGFSKPSSLSSIEAWLKPTASLVGLEDKLGTDPWIGQPTCCGLCRESFFGSSGIHPNLSMTHEWLLYIDHVRYIWSMAIHELSVKYVWCVGRVFSCRVYIDSNRRDSWIWVSLICGSHHVDNVTNSMSILLIDVVLLNTLNCLQLLYD
jgi:hypothetical protein